MGALLYVMAIHNIHIYIVYSHERTRPAHDETRDWLDNIFHEF